MERICGKNRLHPTQKSLPLFIDFMKKYSNEGDTVLQKDKDQDNDESKEEEPPETPKYDTQMPFEKTKQDVQLNNADTEDREQNKYYSN